MIGLTDRPDIKKTVYHGRKATKTTTDKTAGYLQNNLSVELIRNVCVFIFINYYYDYYYLFFFFTFLVSFFFFKTILSYENLIIKLLAKDSCENFSLVTLKIIVRTSVYFY